MAEHLTMWASKRSENNSKQNLAILLTACTCSPPNMPNINDTAIAPPVQPSTTSNQRPLSVGVYLVRDICILM